MCVSFGLRICLLQEGYFHLFAERECRGIRRIIGIISHAVLIDVFNPRVLANSWLVGY